MSYRKKADKSYRLNISALHNSVVTARTGAYNLSDTRNQRQWKLSRRHLLHAKMKKKTKREKSEGDWGGPADPDNANQSMTTGSLLILKILHDG